MILGRRESYRLIGTVKRNTVYLEYSRTNPIGAIHLVSMEASIKAAVAAAQKLADAMVKCGWSMVPLAMFLDAINAPPSFNPYSTITPLATPDVKRYEQIWADQAREQREEADRQREKDRIEAEQNRKEEEERQVRYKEDQERRRREREQREKEEREREENERKAMAWAASMATGASPGGKPDADNTGGAKTVYELTEMDSDDDPAEAARKAAARRSKGLELD